MMGKRDVTFDILKGIGILLMVLGHYFTSESIIRVYIYSFHMPLFMLISGYFYKPKEVMIQVRRDVRSLIVPYLFVCIVIFINRLVLNNEPFCETLKANLYSFLWAMPINSQLGQMNILSVGPLWFLLAIFWVRFLYNVLFRNFKEWTMAIVVVVSLVAMYFNAFVTLPLALLAGFTNLLFYCIGHLIRKYQVLIYLDKHRWTLILALVFWLLMGRKSQLNASYQTLYLAYPVEIITALAGTYLFYSLSRLVAAKTDFLSNQLVLWGKYSLVALCFHAMPLFGLNRWVNEVTIMIYQLLNAPLVGTSIPNLMLSLAIPYLGVLFAPKCKWGRALFNIKVAE